MKRLALAFARLYPAAWRQRYGAEFATFLEECRLRPLDTLDILRGALTLRIAQWSAWKLAGALAFLGVVAFELTFASLPKHYLASIAVRGDWEALRTAAAQAFTRDALAELGRQYRLAPGRNTVDHIRRHAMMGSTLQPGVFQVMYDDSDPQAARNMAAALTTRLVDASKGAVSITGPVTLPTRPRNRNHAAIVSAGCFAGGLLGLALALARRLRRRAAQ